MLASSGKNLKKQIGFLFKLNTHLKVAFIV